MSVSQIIILTGASSSGKSSIAKALQQLLPVPYFHVPLDAFIEMMPYKNDDLFCCMIRAFHASIAAMAREGNHLIVDHVLLLPEWQEELTRLLSLHKVILVGVVCSLPELERREQSRDAVRQGFARSQFAQIHKNRTYDCEIHTDNQTPEQCAAKILSCVQ